MSEHDEQVALFEWADLQTGRYPELESMFSIPNGGKRSKFGGQWLVNEGLKKGVPDVCLPIARAGYHGLYIEMKFDKNKPSEDQTGWMIFLDSQGYGVAVCYGFYIAQDLLQWYLDQEPTKVVVNYDQVSISERLQPWKNQPT